MSDKLKPVRCGCGGEAYYEAYENYNFGSYIAHIMICDKCGMRTAEWPSEAEAIEAWNRAMGERTAKVTDTWKVAGFDELNAWCPECEHRITRGCSYCPTCGVKLDWSE